MNKYIKAVTAGALLCLAAYAVPAQDSPDILRIAVPSRPLGLGNPYSSLPIGAINSNHVLYDALTNIGDKGAILPALALSWESSGDTAWIFKLRPGVEFSNGESFTAQTVVDVITYLRSEEAAGYLIAGETAMIESASLIDDLTVQINTNRPDAILPKRMSFVYMVAMDYWKEVGVDAFGLEPAGSGPFKLKDWGLRTGSYVFERNRSSWRDTGYFDEIKFTAVGDVVSRAQSMLSGQIDLSFKLSLDLLVDLQAAGFNTVARPTYSIGAWAFHQVDKDSPVADVRVRKALNLAIDRESIAATILSGVTQPVSQVATPDVFGYAPDLPLFDYDPDAARALLAEAGYSDSLKLRAIVRSDPSVPESTLIYQVLAQNLAAVGVEIDLNPIPGTRWLSMYFSGDWSGADILDTSFNNSIHGDAIRSIETASCLKAGAYFCDESLLPLIEASNREFDQDLRQKKLQELVTALHQNPPAIYLFPYFDTLAYSPRFNTIPMTGQRVDLERITPKK
ncbi:MAG: ABC transporter substrate-binding protein [Rhodospirillaceae bacterium]|nr:ABC transporter substrate-binding protein [Rhodospirillaceae bacterium]